MAKAETFAIVGASLAGAKAAVQLRTDGFEGRVVLIGEEPVRPYERPPLSKNYLRGETGFDDAAVHTEAFYDEHDIELLTSTRAVALDCRSRQLTLEPGGVLSFDQLIVATGATPRRLTIPGAELEGVHYLRSVADPDELRSAIKGASKIVVVGAGWIGSEITASARQMGTEVALIEVADVPLERVLGREVGAMFAQLHADNDVELHMGVGVEAFRGASAFEAVELADGTEVAGDFVVVGAGVTPRVELAEAAGLATDNGILVDANLATSVPGIWAVGDVANAYHPLFDVRIRLEHWSSALHQGPVAAKNMLGQNVAYERIPYFFSDQYDLGMEYNGFAPTWDEIVYRGDRDHRKVIVFWLNHGSVVAGMNVNVWDVSGPIAALVASRQQVDLAWLADPDIELSNLIT